MIRVSSLSSKYTNTIFIVIRGVDLEELIGGMRENYCFKNGEEMISGMLK